MLDWRRVVLLTSIGAVMSLGACAGKPLTTNGNGSVPLIPRDIIFGNPDRFNVQVSRDGKYLSYCAPVDNVLNVWVAPIDDLSKAKPVTRDTHRGVRHYYWPWTSDAILYLQDEGGNENWNVFRAPLDGGETTNLTPNPKVRAEIYGISDKHPDEMLVALNDRDAAYHDLHRVNVKTGKRTLVLENPRKIDGANVTGFVTDEDYAVRYAFTILDDGTNLMHKPQTGGGWAKAETIPMGDMFGTEPLFFDQTGRALYMKDTRGRDTSAIYAVDAQTGSKTLLAEDSATDADEVLRHPATKRVQAVAFVRERQRWQPVDPDIATDLEALRAVSPGDFTVDSRSHDDTKWVVAYAPDDGPWRYYLYDRPSRKAKFLFTHNSRLEGQPLVKMRPVTIKSRDGLDLVSYLSLPRGSDANDDGIPDRPLPMVLVVHGGPWGRDRWGYNSTHQWLANRGYAVLSVNFRASTGFGKSFVNAGNHEWGGKMHDDLIDGVRWAIDRNIAIPDRVAIHGGSYGGYSALAGVTLTPDVFACSVNIVGISNLITFLQTVPEYWKPGLAILTTRVGDPNTEEGRKLLVSRSPLTHVDRITKPLLIGHGANDARVKQSEADQIVAAMKAKGIPVTYVIYPDEGHGFQRPENRMSFNAVDEAFLSRHLGGRCEPVGDDFTNASIQIEYGAEHIPGLQRK